MVRAAYVWRLDVVRAEPLFIVFVLWNRLATPTDADRAHLVELLPELPGPFVLREPDNVSSEQRTRFESESGRVL
jgi:hypothetical protein